MAPVQYEVCPTIFCDQATPDCLDCQKMRRRIPAIVASFTKRPGKLTIVPINYLSKLLNRRSYSAPNGQCPLIGTVRELMECKSVRLATVELVEGRSRL